MASFTLPSGRIVETHEPLFGEFVHIVATAADNLEELVYAKFAVIVPGLSREEVATLNGADGRALLGEVSRIWEGRSAEDALPLSNGGLPSSTVLSRERSTEKPSNG